MSELQVDRLTTLLKNLFVLRAELGIVPELEDSIYPGVILENDRPEWAFLGGELLQYGSLAAAAVAGELNFIRIRNPSGSGVIVVVEAIAPAPGTQQRTLLVTEGSEAASVTVSGPWNRDLRLNTTTSRIGAVELASGSAAAVAGQVVWEFPSAGIALSFDTPCPIVIDEGRHVEVWGQTPNSSLRVSFRWRERARERSETRKP